MAVLLFRLSNVPDYEAQDLRELLQANDIYFYETDSGFWRMGVDALWLPDNSQEAQARQLVSEYQHQREQDQKKNYAQLVAEGTQITFWDNLKLNPFRVIFALAAIVFILFITLFPFAILLKQS